MIGLGFIVAKFGIYLRAITGASPGSSPLADELVGVFLVVTGSAMIAIAWARFQTIQSQLRQGIYLPRRRAEEVLAGVLVAVGAVLAIYLILTS